MCAEPLKSRKTSFPEGNATFTLASLNGNVFQWCEMNIIFFFYKAAFPSLPGVSRAEQARHNLELEHFASCPCPTESSPNSSPSQFWGLILIFLLLLRISSNPPQLLVTWGCKGEKNWAILWKCGLLTPSLLGVLGGLATQHLSALWVFSITRMCPALSMLDVFNISVRYICFASSWLVHYL